MHVEKQIVFKFVVVIIIIIIDHKTPVNLIQILVRYNGQNIVLFSYNTGKLDYRFVQILINL